MIGGETRARVIPGVLLCVALAAGAMLLSDLPALRDRLHLSPLLLVILLGMAWRSLGAVPAWAGDGIRLAQRPILRWAVAGLGFRLSLSELARIGAPALAVVVVSTAVALAFGVWIARRLGVGEKLALLLGVGGAICGASAIVAADTVVRSDKRDVPLALGVITLFGTIGIVAYPPLGRAVGMSDFLFGVWDGASLHEMAQVVAAGFGVSDEAARVATVVKLARICLLAPVVFGLGFWLRRRAAAVGAARVPIVPWFLVLFLAFAALHSTGVLPAATLGTLHRVDLWLLCIGMAGVGLQTGFRELRDGGLAPMVVGAAQWVVLAGVSFALARLLCGP